MSRESSPDQVAAAACRLYGQLKAQPFDSEHEWPIQVGIVVADGLAHHIVFVVSHTAADGWGMRNLLADFAALLDGGSAALSRARRHRLQPLEEAAFQASARGRRRDAAARRAWCEKLHDGPSSQFPAQAGPSVAERFPNAVLNSPALALAMGRVAAGLAVTPAAVLLAAAAAAAGRLTGVRESVFQVVVNNRFLPGMAGGVNTVAQEGLLHLSRTDEIFAGLVRRTFGATVATHWHSYYDKLALDRDIAQIQERGGTVGDHSCFVNDFRGLMPGLASAKPPDAPLAEARTRTVLTWPVDFEPRHNVTFALDAQDAPGSMELAMTANSAVFPRPEMGQFLYGIEDLVVRQALALGCA